VGKGFGEGGEFGVVAVLGVVGAAGCGGLSFEGGAVLEGHCGGGERGIEGGSEDGGVVV